jgi:hypothetical protein
VPPANVDAFFADLRHPLKSALKAVRAAILGADESIAEGIKWNAPSFYVGREQYFATANIHARGKAAETLLIVLHRGARAKSGRVVLQDPAGLVEWLSPDRGAIRFTSLAEVRRKTPALQAVLRQWIAQV